MHASSMRALPRDRRGHAPLHHTQAADLCPPSGSPPHYLSGCNDTAVQNVKVTTESVDLSLPSAFTADVCREEDASGKNFLVNVTVTLTGGAQLDGNALTYTLDPAMSNAECISSTRSITKSGIYTYSCYGFGVGDTTVTFKADTQVASESQPDVCVLA